MTEHTRQVRILTQPIEPGERAPDAEYQTVTGSHAETVAAYDAIRAVYGRNVQVTLYANKHGGLGRRIREGRGTLLSPVAEG